MEPQHQLPVLPCLRRFDLTLAEAAHRPCRRLRNGGVDVVQQRNQGIESMLT